MNSNNKIVSLYSELSSWWHLLSPIEDYKDEAAFYKQTFLKYSSQKPKTILELGSGGGNNAFFLKNDFSITLVDISPGMLEVSHKTNPECEHIIGDMRSIRLNRIFDSVFIHDAIVYITKEEELQQVMETTFIHCKPGGVALFAPDFVFETFKPYTDHGGKDTNSRGMRYLEWTFDPDKEDTEYIVEFAILLHEQGKNTQIKYDRHVLGLFKRDVWLRLLEDVKFNAKIIEDFEGRDLFVGTKQEN